ncbi:unnamed protein product [Symbiodinium natans]|uniref:EF-hand domain-containing protein n=1 Tax=Symbiodinium natans TaxID=878477 RepID=A0A812UJU4_9DINO|nr:unnamed protein product [Symbiodinium natans]
MPQELQHFLLHARKRGDRHYRIGQVSFSNGQYPEFQNLWQLFQYHDREESGHLDKEEFLQALESCHRLLKSDLPMEAQEAWSQAGGPCTGFVNFSQFAHLAETLGLALPVGLELDGATRPCRFRVRLKNNGDFGQEEYTCSCPCFQAERAGGGVLCQCGHKLSMHRSDFAEDTYANIDSHLRAPSPQRGIWMPGEEGLVAVTDQDLLRKLQDLMNDSHKSHDNWTRDRGCRLHGVNGCSWACAAKNRNPGSAGEGSRLFGPPGPWRVGLCLAFVNELPLPSAVKLAVDLHAARHGASEAFCRQVPSGFTLQAAYRS